ATRAGADDERTVKALPGFPWFRSRIGGTSRFSALNRVRNAPRYCAESERLVGERRQQCQAAVVAVASPASRKRLQERHRVRKLMPEMQGCQASVCSGGTVSLCRPTAACPPMERWPWTDINSLRSGPCAPPKGHTPLFWDHGLSAPLSQARAVARAGRRGP